MAFDEEWAQLKHDAAMRIDHVDPGPIYGGTDGYGKGTEDYTVNYDDLGKVGHDAYLLFNAMEPDGKYARHSSETAGSDLKADGFEMGRALTDVSGVWDTQVSTVLKACAHISNHLDYSSTSGQAEDDLIGLEIKKADGTEMRASEISKYFN